MRTVGKYKNENIEVTELHLLETYRQYLAAGDHVEEINQSIYGLEMTEQIDSFFGYNRPLLIDDKACLNFKKLLPPVMGFAWLRCYQPIKEGAGSHLVVVWFQGKDADPFDEAGNRLRSIDWGKTAKDFEE